MVHSQQNVKTYGSPICVKYDMRPAQNSVQYTWVSWKFAQGMRVWNYSYTSTKKPYDILKVSKELTFLRNY
jgi:hypothetical protein